MAILDDPLEQVREYYGKILKSSSDLKTSACCPVESMPPHLHGLIDDIEPEILERFYGCGAPIPYALEGCTVLDLGCGTGRDVYLASRLVGEDGRVIGVDMTDAALEKARANARLMNLANLTFEKGFAEVLPLADGSVDVVISNGVINLCPDKSAVYREIWRVLRPGGRIQLADVVVQKPVDEGAQEDIDLWTG